MSAAVPQDWALRLQLAAIAGNEPAGSFIEIRPLGRHAAFERSFIPVRELHQAAERVGSNSPAASMCTSVRHRAYARTGPRPRSSASGACGPTATGRESLERLRGFRPLPGVVVRSGSDDHVHGYWPLREPVPRGWAQRANRRLALALDADLAATDPARILRAVGTVNRKHSPPRPVVCTRLELDVFRFERVVGGLPDDRGYTPPARPPANTPRPFARGNASRLLDGLARTVRDARPGNRNHALYWAACRVAEHDLDRDQARDALRDAAVDAGLGEPEIVATLRSALDSTARAA